MGWVCVCVCVFLTNLMLYKSLNLIGKYFLLNKSFDNSFSRFDEGQLMIILD